MSWNYRVIKRLVDNVEFFAIHEVYYDEYEIPEFVTESPACPQGETLEELKKNSSLYVMALEKPVLIYEDF